MTPAFQRTITSRVAGDRPTLEQWLDFHRETLLMKCDGLTAEQLRTAAVPPSNLTLIGLVRHMAEVERSWFAPFVGADQTLMYCANYEEDGDFDNVAECDVDADLAALRREVGLYRREVPRIPLDTQLEHRSGQPYTLRWVLVHMIEEYARHNGHADLIREVIDGATGW